MLLCGCVKGPWDERSEGSGCAEHIHARDPTCRNCWRASDTPISLASDKNAHIASSVSDGFTATSSLNCFAASSYRSAVALQDACHHLRCLLLKHVFLSAKFALGDDGSLCAHVMLVLANTRGLRLSQYQ